MPSNLPQSIPLMVVNRDQDQDQDQDHLLVERRRYVSADLHARNTEVAVDVLFSTGSSTG